MAGKMESLEELENKIRAAGINLVPIKQITGIRLGIKVPLAWSSLDRIGKKISGSWKSDKASWQMISEGRK